MRGKGGGMAGLFSSRHREPAVRAAAELPADAGAGPENGGCVWRGGGGGSRRGAQPVGDRASEEVSPLHRSPFSSSAAVVSFP